MRKKQFGPIRASQAHRQHQAPAPTVRSSGKREKERVAVIKQIGRRSQEVSTTVREQQRTKGWTLATVCLQSSSEEFFPHSHSSRMSQNKDLLEQSQIESERGATVDAGWAIGGQLRFN